MSVTKTLDPVTLHSWLEDGAELALLDVRDLGPYSRAHLWLAVNLPYARLEMRISRYVPRPGARVVLCDDDGRLATRAAAALSAMGYENVWSLDGGIPAWRDAGLPLVDGNYGIAHSLGFFLKDLHEPVTVTAAEVRAMMEEGADFLLLDGRPREDFEAGTLPGSICLPAAEGPLRIHDLVPGPDTQLIYHCGGVTRGVLGAQGLVLAEMANPVCFLQDGTKGWQAAGLTLEPGRRMPPDHTSAEGRRFAAAAAQRLAKGYGLSYITLEELEQIRTESAQCTCYVVDVRSPEEYRQGHLPGALSIPGGELAGMTIDHIATRNARLCLLADAESARAELSAIWMRHLGWPQVDILKDWLGRADLEIGPEPAPPLPSLGEILEISPTELESALSGGGPLLLDFASSGEFAAGHVPGASWALRSQLPAILPKILAKRPMAKSLCVISPRGVMARLIARELAAMTPLSVKALAGGTVAWRAAGFPLEAGNQRRLCAIEDVDHIAASPPDPDPQRQQDHCVWYNRWRQSLYERYLDHKMTELKRLRPAP